MELDDIVVGSRTQDDEAILAALGEEYEQHVIETDSDQPVVDPPAGDPPPETPPAAEVTADPVTPAPPPAEPEPPAPKPTSRVAKWREKAQQATAEVERLRAENEALKQKPAAAPPAPDPAPKPEAPAEKPKPRLKDFVDSLTADEQYEDAQERFAEALLDWREAKKQPSPAAAQPAAAEPEKPQAPASNPFWEAQLAVTSAYHPDFEDLINKDHGKQMSSPVMIGALQQLEDGAERLYQLALHPEVSQRIAQLTNLPENATQAQIDKAFRIAFMELGKLEVPTELEGEEEPEDPAPASPAAPPPPAPAAAAPPATAQPAAAPAAPAPPAPRTKAEPPKPVGSRGVSRSTRIEDLTPDEIRAMDPDEWRARTSGRR